MKLIINTRLKMLKLSVGQLRDLANNRDCRRDLIEPRRIEFYSPSKILRRKYFRIYKKLYNQNRLTAIYFPYLAIPAKDNDIYAQGFGVEKYYVI